MFSLAGYHVTQALYESETSVVYRATQEADRQPVVLKILKDPYPPLDKVAWFKREYEVLRSLHLPGAVKAYALNFLQEHWVITLEDFGGDSLALLGLAGHLDIPAFLHLAIDVSGILGQIHQQRIIHKDINPTNIVLNPATQQVKLIDFGISTVLPHEVTTFHNPKVLEGTLAYMSPEQTGRMNRAMDYRTDLYSLGVTFYELLTGRLPFTGDDALETVHGHIAKQPVPPHELAPEIPPLLSQIVLKLMAKNADDRYQSAYGLKADLEACLVPAANLHQLSFTLGRQDILDHFHIPQRLYGRAQEIETLLAGFHRISQGERELMLVAGYSGIGKSALVQELYKPITQQRGYFIAGKCDQFQRNIPYASLIQAFRALIRQLLTESEADIAAWREQLLAALGPNGQVIVEVIPEAELILGPQPAVPTLGSTETQNRFNLVFLNFIRVFTQPSHPLVLFLDDLQWVDGPTLHLLQMLMTDPSTHYLLVIGAYRDNDVTPSHPLMLTLAEIAKTETPLSRIMLEGLAVPDVTQLLADTLHCSGREADPLAELVARKTAGNPFFVNQFLMFLYTDELCVFDPTTGNWQWDLSHIAQQEITDNVVDLMADKLRSLSSATQRVLQLAACIGNQFALDVLAVVHEKSPHETARDLWPAIQEDLIQPLDDTYKLVEVEDRIAATVHYKFLHDRVRQAAYSLIAEDDRQALHLQIGRLMWRTRTPEELENHIFDLVNQLNVGVALMTDTAEKTAAAQLNLIAGQKAKSAIAYASAVEFAATGLALLPSDSWQTAYELTLALYETYAQCAYLTGHFEAADTSFDTAFDHAQTTLDKLAICILRVDLYTAQSKYVEALTVGRMGLQLLGIDLPSHTAAVDPTPELTTLQVHLGNRPIADLIHLPPMLDQEQIYTVRMLTYLIPAGFFLNPGLFALIVAKQMNVLLVYGNCQYSSYIYACYGILLCSAMGQFEAAYQFGQLAFKVDEKFEKSDAFHRPYQAFGTFMNHFRCHANINLEYLRKAYQYSIENGDIIYAGYCGMVLILDLLLLGHPLDEVYTQSQHYLDFALRSKYQDSINCLIASQLAILNLQGKTVHPTRFSTEQIDENAFVADVQASLMKVNLNWYYILKLRSLYLFEDYREALEMALKSAELLPLSAGLLQVPEHYLYYCLTLAALYPDATAEVQEAYWDTLTDHQAQMKIWADNALDNFEHKYLLVAAEMARISGQLLEALDLYDRAIAAANAAAYTNNAALANELAAKCYLTHGRAKAAQPYLRDAHYGYLRWGATAKVKQLEETYPHLLARTQVTTVTESVAPGTATAPRPITGTRPADALDLTSVLKASQAISGEIVLEALLAQIMRIIIENAGAERGVLLLHKAGDWVIEAEAVIDQDVVTVFPSIPVNPLLEDGANDQTAPRLPMTIINYVAHTQDHVVLNDALHEGVFTQDRYIAAAQPHSILCAPLLHQGQLDGIVYLENNLTTGAFTPDRLEVLNLLSSQAAISIKNASLYRSLQDANAQLEDYSRTLEQRVDRRTRELQTKNQELESANQQIREATERKIRFFNNMSHELRTPLDAVIGFSQVLEEQAYGALNDQQLEYVNYILTSGTHLLGLINDILDLAKLDAGMTDLLVEAFPLKSLLENSLVMVQERAVEHGIGLSLEVDEAIDAVVGDERRVKQILINLLSNAVKFTPDQGKVGIKATRMSDAVLIAVWDTGVGIALEDQQRIFEEFQQVGDKRMTMAAGTGLGLVLTKKFVELHGGTIEVKSHPGQGSTFTFSLPAADSWDADEKPRR